jgi:hypothetical protein
MNHTPLKLTDDVTIEQDMRYQYEVAKASGLPDFTVVAEGQKFTFGVGVVDDLETLHNLDGIKELALAIEKVLKLKVNISP